LNTPLMNQIVHYYTPCNLPRPHTIFVVEPLGRDIQGLANSLEG